MNRIKPTLKRASLATLTLTVVASSAFGCGEDSASSSTPDASGGLTGEPIKIMTMAPIEATSGTSIVSPETAAAAQAAAARINADGGIDGRPLEVIVCDEKSDPNAAQACARKAVEEEVVALVGTYSQFSDKAYPILEENKIANFGNIPVTAPDGVSEMSFPVNAGSAVLVAIGQAAAERDDCEKPGLVQIDSTAKDLITAGVLGGVALAGKELAYNIALSPTSQDYSGQAAEAADSGDCTVMFTVPGTALAFIPALRQVADQPIIASNNSVSAEVADKLGAMLDDTLVPDYFPPYNSDAKKKFRDTMETYSDKDVDFTHYNATNAYISVNIFAEIAAGIEGEITHETFLAALEQTSGVSVDGLTPPIDFTKANEWSEVPFQKRIFNRNMVFTEIKDGEQVQVGDFRDFTVDGGKAFALALGG